MHKKLVTVPKAIQKNLSTIALQNHTITDFGECM